MGEARNNPEARAFKPKTNGILDARKRKLEIGDEILLDTGHPIYYRVIGIKPALDPRLPPNQFLVEVASAVHFIVNKGVQNLEFIRVRTAEEAGPMNMFKAEDEKVVGS